jgi:hypothetical protein
MAGYWGRVAARAWRETRHAFRWESAERIVIPVIGAILAVFLVWTVGGEVDKFFLGKVVATAAVVLLVPGVFVWKFIGAPSKMDAEVRQELDDLRIPVGGPVPDWTIRELFDHLRPEPAERLCEYEVCGKDVLDKISTGHLTLWGRDKRGDDWSRLHKIDPSICTDGDFTYVFLVDDHEEAPHLRSGNHPLERPKEFAGLRVNKAEALRLWPRDLGR